MIQNIMKSDWMNNSVGSFQYMRMSIITIMAIAIATDDLLIPNDTNDGMCGSFLFIKGETE